MSEFFGPDLTKLEYTVKEFLKENEQKYLNDLRLNKNIKDVVRQVVSDFNEKYNTCLSESVFIDYAGTKFIIRNITDVLFLYEMFHDVKKYKWDVFC